MKIVVKNKFKGEESKKTILLFGNSIASNISKKVKETRKRNQLVRIELHLQTLLIHNHCKRTKGGKDVQTEYFHRKNDRHHRCYHHDDHYCSTWSKL